MLYLYTNVVRSTNHGELIHVVRSSNELYNKSPDYEVYYCPPFSQEELTLIRKTLGKGENYNLVPRQEHHGWLRFPDYAVEQLIIGCIACDIELEVIEWNNH